MHSSTLYRGYSVLLKHCSYITALGNTRSTRADSAIDQDAGFLRSFQKHKCLLIVTPEHEMERTSQQYPDGAFEDWEHGQGLEFDPNEPPPPYSTLPEPNHDNTRPQRMARPCVVPRRCFLPGLQQVLLGEAKCADLKATQKPRTRYTEASTVPLREPTLRTSPRMTSAAQISSPSSMP